MPIFMGEYFFIIMYRFTFLNIFLYIFIYISPIIDYNVVKLLLIEGLEGTTVNLNTIKNI